VVLRLLELLDMVDKHLFHVSQWSSTVTALYDKIQNFSNVSCLYMFWSVWEECINVTKFVFVNLVALMNFMMRHNLLIIFIKRHKLNIQ